MEKRKIILTILLALVLALLTSYLIFMQKKPVKHIEKTQPVTEYEETVQTEPEDEEEQQAEEAKPEIPATPQKPVKKTSTLKSTSTKKIPKSIQIQELSNTEQETPEPEIQKGSVESEPPGVEVPVKYMSQNTYKYVYTPSRFLPEKTSKD